MPKVGDALLRYFPVMISTVYLGIGSNSGDRAALIGRAVALIAMRLPVLAVRTSSFYRSEPWGFESENDFLNIVVALRYERSGAWSVGEAEALLDILQEIEREISSMPHRNADGTYRDREIDIDIIGIDGRHIATDRLEVPHPRAHMRDFVTVPLGELTNINLIS